MRRLSAGRSSAECRGERARADRPARLGAARELLDQPSEMQSRDGTGQAPAVRAGGHGGDRGRLFAADARCEPARFRRSDRQVGRADLGQRRGARAAARTIAIRLRGRISRSVVRAVPAIERARARQPAGTPGAGCGRSESGDLRLSRRRCRYDVAAIPDRLPARTIRASGEFPIDRAVGPIVEPSHSRGGGSGREPSGADRSHRALRAPARFGCR